jgi:hypothetical protein
MEGLDWQQSWQQHSVLRVHPTHLLGPEDRAVIDLWLPYRPDGMGRLGHLPYSGGYAEQPSALMRLLDAMNSAEGRIRERQRNKPGTGG